MKTTVLLIAFIIPTVLFSQSLPTGPGGVGNSADNGLWLKADAVTGLANDAPVVTWNDVSGNNNHADNIKITEQPVYKASSSINNRPSVFFDGILDQMIIADDPILDGTAGITYYTVIRPHNLDTKPRGILGKRSGNGTDVEYAYIFSFYQTANNNLNTIFNKQKNIITTSNIAYTNDHDYMLGFDFEQSRSEDRMRIYDAGKIVKFGKGLDEPIKNSSEPLVIGGHNKDYQETTNGPHYRLGADYAEVIHYNRALNTAERIIVENYLGAKYNIAVENPYYDFGSTHPGEVAGIGQETSGIDHTDAQGSGIVRINTPSTLGNKSYLLWGHDEALYGLNNIIDVDGTYIQSRMSRSWAVTETGDVGTVTISFDVTGFTPMTHSDVRLLIDRNGNGFLDNDVVPIVGTAAGNIITFSGVQLQNGDKFTLGSINVNQTPLPVELTDFNLESKERSVDVLWTTASELNADYYLLSKSKDGKTFKTFAQVKANGTTSSISNYKEIDKTPYSGVSYYQLTQVDFDGESKKYGPISVNRQQDQSFVLVPNPTDGVFKLKSALIVDENTTLSIFSSVGSLVREIILTPEEVNTKKINLDLRTGVYFVKINEKDEVYTSMKLVVR